MKKTLTELYNDHSHFMITAHRGASFEFPENTLLSMEKAVEAGADMIEFDLRGTSDDIPVLLHDETINRTSNGKGRPEEKQAENKGSRKGTEHRREKNRKTEKRRG